MGGTRISIRNMKDAQNKGLAPDMDAIHMAAPEQVNDPQLQYTQALTSLRQDENYSRMADSLQALQGSVKYAENGFKRFFAGKDSKEYTRVQNALSAVLDSMTLTLTDDAKTNLYIIQNAGRKYEELVNACNVYMKKKGGESATGRYRKEKISQILKYATMDLDEIKHLIADSEDFRTKDLSGMKWTDILADARSEVIEVEDLSSITSFGAGAKKDDQVGRILAEGMFAPEQTEVLRKDGKESRIGDNMFTAKSENGGYGFQEGEKINVSRRNVATSVVAQLLGIQNVVEQSKTVKVYDQASHTTVRGNLMTKAKGTGADDVIDKEKKHLRTGNDLMNREDRAGKLFAPSVQKELASLQVLDYICGQGDRNNANFFLEYDEELGQYAHVHGIDNDMAFSTGVEFEEIIKDNRLGGTYGHKLRNVVSSKDDLEIPHMDKTLAMNIRNLKDDELRFALQGLIEPRFIEFAVQRLAKVRNAVNKELQKKDSKVFLEDGEWGEQSHKDFIANSFGGKLYKDLREKGISNLEEYKKTRSLRDKDDKLSEDVLYEMRRGDSYYSKLMNVLVGFGDTGAGGKYT